MHPFNYEVTVKTVQLEIEHASRQSTKLAEFMPAPEWDSNAPRRIDSLLRRILGAISPPSTRRATAD